MRSTRHQGYRDDSNRYGFCGTYSTVGEGEMDIN
jgi:hypothetical protein